MAWCYADYDPGLWDKHPLEECMHERHFGMFRHDETAKPAVEIFRGWANSPSAHPLNNTPIRYPGSAKRIGINFTSIPGIICPDFTKNIRNG